MKKILLKLTLLTIINLFSIHCLANETILGWDDYCPTNSPAGYFVYYGLATSTLPIPITNSVVSISCDTNNTLFITNTDVQTYVVPSYIKMDAGLANQYTISNLLYGSTYVLRVTAYSYDLSSNVVESTFSTSISITVTNLPPSHVRVIPGPGN